jgi:thiol-disulfide isomerase/thioredoxin
MPDGFSVGPFLIPTRPFAVILSLLLAIWVSRLTAARIGVDARRLQRLAEGCAWSGVLGARLGFVLMNWGAFEVAPWTALYIWQPGYSPLSGLIAGTGYALWQTWPRPANERRSDLKALGTGYAAGALLAISVLGTMNMIGGPYVIRTGEHVQDFTLADLKGNTVRFSDLKGKAIVLNFWATWCPPCRREIPLLNGFQKEYASRGVSVVGVDVGETTDVVRAFVESIGVAYPVWVDAPKEAVGFDRTQEIHSRFGGVGLPTTIFIDPDGIVRNRHLGELSRAVLENEAENLLDK